MEADKGEMGDMNCSSDDLSLGEDGRQWCACRSLNRGREGGKNASGRSSFGTRSFLPVTLPRDAAHFCSQELELGIKISLRSPWSSVMLTNIICLAFGLFPASLNTPMPTHRWLWCFHFTLDTSISLQIWVTCFDVKIRVEGKIGAEKVNVWLRAPSLYYAWPWIPPKSK